MSLGPKEASLPPGSVLLLVHPAERGAASTLGGTSTPPLGSRVSCNCQNLARIGFVKSGPALSNSPLRWY